MRRPVRRRTVAGFVATLSFAACSSQPTTSTDTVPDGSPAPSASTEATATTTPPMTGPVVDATTLAGKAIFGYQGWFSCPGDGAGFDQWQHWFGDDAPPVAASLTVDLWPDMSEVPSDEQCLTDMVLPDGSPLMATSAYRTETVMRHFRWMDEYGIDGVEVQRFTIPEDEGNETMQGFRDRVLDNVRLGAETYGRVFYVQFAAVQDGGVELIKQDWIRLVDEMQLTESPQYLHHDGLPVVGLWGVGFAFESGYLSPDQAADLIAFFQFHPDPEYRATVSGGVPAGWRTLSGASFTDPAWAEVYRSLDVINPWSVGVFASATTADEFFENVVLPDIVETTALGIDYMPVAWPGFSWKNLWAFRGREESYNQIPRNGGRFYWRQVSNLLSADVGMIEVAMFDEIDEGTAMYKLAGTVDELPAEGVLVPLDVDGFRLPSDWYLRLGGETGKMLRGEIAVSPGFPFQGELDQLAVDMVPELAAVVGEWKATDIDGFPLSMTISQPPDGTFDIEMVDTFTDSCGNSDRGLTLAGAGDGRGDTVYAFDAVVACVDSSPGVLFRPNYTLTYDPATDTMRDVWNLAWTRR